MHDAETGGSTRSGLWCAGVGLVLAVFAVIVVNGKVATGAVTDAHLSVLLGYGATWVPMLGAVIVFAALTRGRRAQAVLGIRFLWIDLLWGGAIGILARSIASISSITAYGTTGLTGQPVIGGIDGWYVFGALIAPALIAPLIEEEFFRGLMQGALELRLRSTSEPRLESSAIPEAGFTRRVAPSQHVAQLGAVAVVSVMFVAVHLIGATSPVHALVLGLPLLLFAVGAGVARAYTGRIGGAVVAHVVFNGSAVLLMWPW
ncbi:MAG: CPBP family intramembrane metalloprotease [Microbacteriaceae bacterium]|nr:MAG: CPBP family intramembrane metalloprotease [Microbacteriaceae bacterium]